MNLFLPAVLNKPSLGLTVVVVDVESVVETGATVSSTSSGISSVVGSVGKNPTVEGARVDVTNSSKHKQC